MGGAGAGGGCVRILFYALFRFASVLKRLGVEASLLGLMV